MKPQGSTPSAVSTTHFSTLGNGQAGGGILGVVAMVGVTFALVQGSLFYRAKSSVRFQAKEQNKVLAQQIAEAGVEENIADLGSRRLRPTAGMNNYVTYSEQGVGAGTFTTRITMVARDSVTDTLDLTSRGRVASTNQEIRARLRLKRYIDSLRTITMKVEPETTVVRFTTPVEVITITTEVQDPELMPPLNTTSAYEACMSSSAKKCDVCHIPLGNPDNRHVIDVNKSAIDTHVDHHGDYVTTDGTCDIYNPREVKHITIENKPDSTVTIVDKSTYDTSVVVDTIAKVQILSWK